MINTAAIVPDAIVPDAIVPDAFVPDASVRPRSTDLVTPSGEAMSSGDYFRIASTRRFRASQRRRIQTSARHGMILVVAAAALDCLWEVPGRADAAAIVVPVNVALAILATLAYIALGSIARRRAEAVTLLMLFAVTAAIMRTGLSETGLWLIAAGYLLLLPAVVSLVIPWSTRRHVMWLATYGVVASIFIVRSPDALSPLGEREDLFALLIITTTISQLGHVASLRARVQSFVQIERIRSLYRQSGRDRARLHRLNAGLQRTAHTDDLTGLKNRLSLALDLEATRSRIDRHDERYALVVIDIDHFKSINDALGHLAGDGALCSVGRTISNAVRPGDGVYRFGGDEFVAMLRVADRREAVTAVERIVRAVRALELTDPETDERRHLSVTAGATLVGRQDLEATDDDWFARADRELYIAKVDGRDRAKVA